MFDDPSGRFYNPLAFAFDAEVAIALIAELQIRKAIERGEFDDLPGSGQPLDLPDHHDPDWWIKNLMKREHLVLLPASIQLRKDDAALDELLDSMWSEQDVRHEIELFNERVIRARYDLPAGPPLTTMPRDVDATVTAWSERKTARRRTERRDAALREELRRTATDEATSPKRQRRERFSRTRTDTSMGVPSKPNSSRRRRSMKRR